MWQNYGTQEALGLELPIARKAFDKIAGVLPFGVVPGNHDYDRSWTDEKEKTSRVDGGASFNKYFGPESPYFSGKSWYGGSWNGGMNSFQTFTAGGYRFLHIGLELEPSDSAIAWAQRVIDEHPESPVILTTHEYLGWEDEPDGSGKARRLEDPYRKGFNRNTPQMLWEKLIAPNPQIFLVLCGHNYSGAAAENSRVDLNDDGLPVYQLLADYQGRTELWDSHPELAKIKAGLKEDESSPYKGVADKERCGDGWLRFSSSIRRTRHPCPDIFTELKRFETDEDSDFVLAFDGARGSTLSPIPIVPLAARYNFGMIQERVGGRIRSLGPQGHGIPQGASGICLRRGLRRPDGRQALCGSEPRINGVCGDVRFFGPMPHDLSHARL